MVYFPRDRKSIVGKSERFRFKKSKDVGPDHYHLMRELTEKKVKTFSFGKGKNKNFVDQYIKLKKVNPGVGKYKNPEASFN